MYSFIDMIVRGLNYLLSVALSGAAFQPIMTSNRRPAGQLDGAGNLAAIVAADRAFPAAVAELGR
jgi:hypothetical protein